MVYSNELINEALELRARGVSAKSVCERLAISASNLRKWEVDHAVTVPAGMTDTQLIWNLRSRIFELQTELEIWNQCSCCRNRRPPIARRPPPIDTYLQIKTGPISGSRFHLPCLEFFDTKSIKGG